jgi:hypothetical protein
LLYLTGDVLSTQLLAKIRDYVVHYPLVQHQDVETAADCQRLNYRILKLEYYKVDQTLGRGMTPF